VVVQPCRRCRASEMMHHAARVAAAPQRVTRRTRRIVASVGVVRAPEARTVSLGIRPIGPLTALTWAPDAPLVTAMDPTTPGPMARQWPAALGWQILAHIGADQP
jgi:hypothetical protein